MSDDEWESLSERGARRCPPTMRAAMKTAIQPRVFGRATMSSALRYACDRSSPFFCAPEAAAAHVERMSRNSQVSASSGMR